MDWVSEIIDSLGGTIAVATALDLPETNVSSWKSRGMIRPRYWPSLVLLARQRGKSKLTLERLAQLASAADADRASRGRRGKAA
jgi:hypothetical protein